MIDTPIAEQLRAALKADSMGFLKAQDTFVRAIREIAAANGVQVDGILGMSLTLDGDSVVNCASLVGRQKIHK